jgi:type II secretory pathway pseudopilin PulG
MSREASVTYGHVKHERQAGFTVLEAAVALSMLAIALLALWGTLVYCTRSNAAAEQKKRAMNAAQGKIEELKAVPFHALIGEFGPGGATGDRFHVSSLDDELSGAEGRIVFYTDETDTVTDPSIGLPMDLNGDGDAADRDVAGSYLLLPVKISIHWDGVLGPQRLDLRTILRREE